MKTIYKIARTELQTLFYSPVAWLILVIFTFQASMVFTNGLAGNVRSQELGYGLYNVTMGVFAGWRGMFTAMQQYLYLYICRYYYKIGRYTLNPFRDAWPLPACVCLCGDWVVHVEYYFLSSCGCHGDFGGAGGVEFSRGYVAGY